MSKATQGFLFLLGILVAIGCVTGQIVDTFFHNRVTYGQEVGMVQPSGWNLNRDQQASQVNVNNGQANAYNGQLHVANAEATAIVDTAETTLRTQYVGGIGVGICLGVPATIVGLFVLIAIIVNRNKTDE